jgi:cellulose synthase/poly-beta-1,6-N-acetylglucosamine synthase-like glycosyltransferase
MDAQNKIRVSVVIPCYNDGQFIEEAIASVEAFQIGIRLMLVYWLLSHQ